ncbi:hypothetical protein AB0M22_41715 [Nocardia sp. NPDC051756]|uniref:hypothetical protein n=1 Tax=Nocardia sp. NPDC051756 TaxID=3154751 RepID=UPI00342D8676
MTDFLDGEALDFWLGWQRQALLSNIAAHLDLEAGLRETLIQVRHVELVTSLRGVLDLEAGLAAIMPAARLAPPPPLPDNSLLDDAAVLELGPSFQAMPLMVRLELRHVCAAGMEDAMLQARRMADTFVSTSTHPLFQEGGVGSHGWRLSEFEIDMYSGIKRLEEGTSRIAELLSPLLVEENSSQLLDGIDSTAMQWLQRTRLVLRASVRRLGSASQMFRCAVERRAWRPTATWLDDARGAARTVHKIIDHFARELLNIEQVLNNFTGEDLRAIDLDGVRLAGVCWSTETLWPEAWREQIEHDSFPIGDGVFEIRGGTDTQQNALV